MKKSLLLAVFLPALVWCQQYVPFPTENAQWNVRYTTSAEYFQDTKETRLLKYTLRGDTVFENVQYKKLCLVTGTPQNPVYTGVGGLRESNKQIFYVGNGYIADAGRTTQQRVKSITDCGSFAPRATSGYEILLYDFNVHVGDEIQWGYRTGIIEKIDSILLGHSYRKTYRLKNSSELVVEGIGNVNSGLLGWISPIPTCGGSYEWEHVCFSQNGEALYLNPAYVECGSTEKWSDKKYLAEDACWTFIKGSPSNKSQTFINGDTLLNGKLYKKVFFRLSNLQTNYAGAIREENGKFFANIDTQYLQSGEFLIYDFTVKTGDTIQGVLKNGSELNESRIVTKIDIITLLNGETRKRISFNSSKPWIEGIGNTSGLFYPASPLKTDLDEPEIVCFKQNNTQLYTVPEFCPENNCCDLLAGIHENQADLKRTKLLPNPAFDFVQLTFANTSETCTSIEIMDFQGRKINSIPAPQTNSLNIDLSAYRAGIYFVVIRFAGKSETHKLIKM